MQSTSVSTHRQAAKRIVRHYASAAEAPALASGWPIHSAGCPASKWSLVGRIGGLPDGRLPGCQVDQGCRPAGCTPSMPARAGSLRRQRSARTRSGAVRLRPRRAERWGGALSRPLEAPAKVWLASCLTRFPRHAMAAMRVRARSDHCPGFGAWCAPAPCRSSRGAGTGAQPIHLCHG